MIAYILYFVFLSIACFTIVDVTNTLQYWIIMGCLLGSYISGYYVGLDKGKKVNHDLV